MLVYDPYSAVRVVSVQFEIIDTNTSVVWKKLHYTHVVGVCLYTTTLLETLFLMRKVLTLELGNRGISKPIAQGNINPRQDTVLGRNENGPTNPIPSKKASLTTSRLGQLNLGRRDE